MWRKMKDKLFNGYVKVKVPQVGKLRVHPMKYYQFAPTPDADYKKLENFLEAVHGIYRDDLLKPFYQGQEIVSIELHNKLKRSTYYIGFPDIHHDYLAERLRYTYKGSGIQKQDVPFPDFDPEQDNCTVGEYKLAAHPFKSLRQDVDGQMTEALLHAFDGVNQNEELLLQILLEPIDDWQDEIFHTYQRFIEGEEVLTGVGAGILLGKSLKIISDIPRNIALDIMNQEKEQKHNHKPLKLTEAKLTKKAFHVFIRAIAKSENKQRRHLLLNSILNALRVMNADNTWKLSMKKLTLPTLISMQERRMPALQHANLLSFPEMKPFLQSPTKAMESESLLMMTPDEAKPDKRLSKGGIHIGYSPAFQDTGELIYIPVADHDDGAKVRAWIASPGGGKSTQIEALVDGAAELGHGFAAYDGKDGVMFHRLLSTIQNVKEENQFEILNYENEDRPPIFNFDALGSEGQSAGSMFAELFSILFSGKDLVTSRSFAIKCAQSVFTDPLATFLEFIQMLRDSDFRNQFIPKLRDKKPDLYLWWKQEFPKISDAELQRMNRPILDRMENDILYNEKMSHIICGRGGAINYYKWMQEGKAVLVNAPLGHFTEPELQFIMALHNYASWNATLARRKITQSGKRARLFHLIYDEPQNYMDATPIIQTAIAKARAYSVSYNFFIQEAEQIIEKSPALWKCILGMSPMLMVGPVSENTARLLSKELDVKVEDILRIKQLKYHWWYKGYADKAAVPSQIIRAVEPIDKRKPPVPLIDRSLLIEKHAVKYAPMNKTEIQEDISARNFRLSLSEYRDLLNSYTDESKEGVLWEESENLETSEKK